MKLEFSRQGFYKKGKTSGFIKIRPEGAEMFHADGQTDMANLMVAFHNLRTRLKVMELEQSRLATCMTLHGPCISILTVICDYEKRSN
jgi:hypothetical protein